MRASGSKIKLVLYNKRLNEIIKECGWASCLY